MQVATDDLQNGDFVERDHAAAALLERIEKNSLEPSEVQRVHNVLSERLAPLVKKLKPEQDVPGTAISKHEYQLLWRLIIANLLPDEQKAALLNALAPSWLDYTPSGSERESSAHITIRGEFLRPPGGTVVHRVIRAVRADGKSMSHNLLDVFVVQRKDAGNLGYSTGSPALSAIAANSLTVEVQSTWYIVPQNLVKDLPTQGSSLRPEALEQIRQLVAGPNARTLSKYRQNIVLTKRDKWQAAIIAAQPTPVTKAATQPAADELSGSTLAVCIVPNAAARANRSAMVSPEIITKMKKQLAAQGPQLPKEHEQYWWAILDKSQPAPAQAVLGQHQSKQCILLCAERPRALTQRKPPWPGHAIVSASVVEKPQDKYAIQIDLDDSGAQGLSVMTQAFNGMAMAFVIDGEVVSTETIRERIKKTVTIVGGFSRPQAQKLCSQLLLGMPAVNTLRRPLRAIRCGCVWALPAHICQL